MDPSATENRTLPASLDLSGRRALVTGGSRGIGRAICMALAARGAAVAVNYARGEAAANEVVAAIEAAGGTAAAVGFDVGDKDAVEAGFKAVAEKLGGLDILVNNAGISIDNLVMRIKEEEWDALERVNADHLHAAELLGCFHQADLGGHRRTCPASEQQR